MNETGSSDNESSITGWQMSERLVCKLKKDWDVDSLTFSPDGKRIAYLTKRKSKHQVIVDGIEHSEYDYVSRKSMKFSPNSKEFAYVACDKREEKKLWFVVVNGEEGTMHDSLWTGGIIFSENGERFAYVGGDWIDGQEKRCAVINGEKGKYFDSINNDSFSFNPDSGRYAYVAIDDGKYFAVIDGIEEKKYLYISRPVFCPHGKRVAYVARNQSSEKRDSIITNWMESRKTTEGKKGTNRFLRKKELEKLWEESYQGNSCVAVSDGNEGKRYFEIFHDSLTFSPDGQKLAYIAMNAATDINTSDRDYGDEEKSGCSNTTLDEMIDMNKLVEDKYGIIDDLQEKIFGKYGAGCVVVVEEKESETYFDISQPLYFSPDSKRLAFIAIEKGLNNTSCKGEFEKGKHGEEKDKAEEKTDKKYDDRIFWENLQYPGKRKEPTSYSSILVVDGEEHCRSQMILLFCFSPDSKRIAFSQFESNSYSRAVVDGVPGEYYFGVGVSSVSGKSTLFSPDGKHAAYMVMDDHGKWNRVVIDGEEGPEVDEIVQHTMEYSVDGKRLFYIANMNGSLFPVMNGKATRGYYDISWHSFSPTGKYHACAAEIVTGLGEAHGILRSYKKRRDFDEIEKEPSLAEEYKRYDPDGKPVDITTRKVIVIDQWESPPISGTPMLASMNFESDDKLHSLVYRDGDIHYVELSDSEKEQTDSKVEQTDPGVGPSGTEE